MKKILKYIKDNKFLFIILGIFFIILCYCHFNTFLGNDDLPYSFFKRLNQRVTNPFQILWDNLRYYKSTNGRFLIHCIIMTLLVFGKSVWSIFNPLVIIGIIFIIVKLIIKNKNIKSKILVTLLSSSLFLMFYNFKNLIYWVAGSVNYLWVCFFIFIYIYLYLKKDILKYKKINYFLFFVLSTLHENSFVFFLIFIITLNVIEYIKIKKIQYWKYIIPILLGGTILLLAPGNLSRSGGYGEWEALSFFGKLNLSIPVVSKSVFDLFNIHNLIPTIYIFTMLLKLLFSKYSIKLRIVFIFLIVLVCSISFITNFGYLHLILAIILFITEIYIHIKENEECLIPIETGFYALAFSMVVTPLYNSFRPNLLIHIYFIFMICKFLMEIIKNKKIIKIIVSILSVILFIIMSIFEINIYYNIGKCHKERLNQIEEYKKEDTKEILYLKKIPEKYVNYHQDCNNVDENFWTYRWFIWYYGLPENTIIRYK